MELFKVLYEFLSDNYPSMRGGISVNKLALTDQQICFLYFFCMAKIFMNFAINIIVRLVIVDFDSQPYP